MNVERVEFHGNLVRLEPLELHHAGGLAAASAGAPELYHWSPIPQGKDSAAQYIDTALSWEAAGTALPFAIVRLSDNRVIGSSRFWNIEHWPWPQGHPQHGRVTPDSCEIGYSWFAHDAIRTGANTESKLLMLRHAFETWKCFRVCFHTDARNIRSRAALERIGAKFEGVLRSHRMAADFIPRDSYRFSIIDAEWPGAKERLQKLLVRP
ncbi:MAG: GNAT family protein [Terriglobales bacterium]